MLFYAVPVNQQNKYAKDTGKAGKCIDFTPHDIKIEFYALDMPKYIKIERML